MKNKKDLLMNLMPIFGLVIVVVTFAFITEGKSISPINLKILTNQIIVVALVSIGAVFSFSCGAIDMSLGGTIGLSGVAGALVGLRTESFLLMIIVTVIVALLISVIKGIIAAYLTLPIFIVTLIFGSLLSAIGLVALGTTTTLSLGKIIPEYNVAFINILFIATFYIFSLIIFNYTKIGKGMKLLGGNKRAAIQSGISYKKNIIIAFLMSGVGVSLATIITMLKTKTITAQTGGSVGFDILVAIVIGGMPLSGGPRSKISAGLVGAATITILNNGLSIANVDNDVIQIVRGIIFLSVVFITSMSYRTELLPK